MPIRYCLRQNHPTRKKLNKDPYISSVKRLSQLIQNESFEPMFAWGLRMALAGTVPVLWGLSTGRVSDAIWITLTAEAITWTELKGSFSWRVRVLLAGTFLAVFFSLVGSLVAHSVWLSVVCMLVVGFFATLLKSIGDRASGLALCVYLMFIICNAYPLNSFNEILHRLALIGVGAVWPVAVGFFISLLMPAQEPFRRHIAIIWRSVAELAGSVAGFAAGKEGANRFYPKEKEVRTAIDNSYQFYGKMVHQIDEKDEKYQLYMLRKIAGIISVNLAAVAEEVETNAMNSLDASARVKLITMLDAMREAVSRISVFIITLKPEEKLLASSNINRVNNLLALLRQLHDGRSENIAINRILHLTERNMKLMESALQRIGYMEKEKPVFRSYSLIKTSFVLKPQYFFADLRGLFQVNTLTLSYALRSAVAAAVALFAAQWFKIDHGYWMPLSVMIIIQPYFGATFKKATDRIAGTLAGGISGSLFLYLPAGLHIKEVILFLSFIFMVYYLRRNYAIAAFVITLNLVLLFNIESAFDNMLMVTRALCTIGGALLAIGAGFVLLPTWDKKWLPSHLAEAIRCNYEYFIITFYQGEQRANWIKYKRVVESKNSNVFDSFNRYMQEPGEGKSTLYFDLVMHNIRVTRNLNNIHLEQDEAQKNELVSSNAVADKVSECCQLFHELLSSLKIIGYVPPPAALPENSSLLKLNDAQMVSLQKLNIELKTMIGDIIKLKID